MKFAYRRFGLVQLPHNVILQGTVMGLPLLLCTFVSPIKEGISGSLVLLDAWHGLLFLKEGVFKSNNMNMVSIKIILADWITPTEVELLVYRLGSKPAQFRYS